MKKTKFKFKTLKQDKYWKMQCDYAWELCKWWYAMTKEQKIKYAFRYYRGESSL